MARLLKWLYAMRLAPVKSIPKVYDWTYGQGSIEDAGFIVTGSYTDNGNGIKLPSGSQIKIPIRTYNKIRLTESFIASHINDKRGVVLSNGANYNGFTNNLFGTYLTQSIPKNVEMLFARLNTERTIIMEYDGTANETKFQKSDGTILLEEQNTASTTQTIKIEGVGQVISSIKIELL